MAESTSSSEKASLRRGNNEPLYFYTNFDRAEASSRRSNEEEPLVIREKEPVSPQSSGIERAELKFWPFHTKNPEPMPKVRKVPVKVEPKVFFSNERTFIAWMNMAVTLSTIATAILAFANHNPWSQVYGLILLPVSISFIFYALYKYLDRSRKIRIRSPGPYEDVNGPIILASMLMIAIITNCLIKFYDMYR
mmetsp:Transcript_18485/g.26063  ORF Transcript_18485/g.26063 Transcript_18485/m.26063 type:complete len:193 (-) Transcript_18485:82-660(-)